MLLEENAMLRKFLLEQIQQGAFPGAALCVYQNDRILVEEYVGTLSDTVNTPVTPDTRYDLASVTKTYISASIALLLERGELSLDDPASLYLRQLRTPEKEAITIRQLCTHTAGLFGNPELHKQIPDRVALWQRFFDEPLRTPPMKQVFYTSVGYQFLGYIIEEISGMTLDCFLRKNILDPLGLSMTAYLPQDKNNIAWTEFSAFRNRICIGEVHDDNCYVLGGICGHAGLFSTAREVARFGSMLVCGGTPVFTGTVGLSALFTDMTSGLEQNRTIGFIVNNPDFGNWTCETFVHTGFTGTSLFLVPKYHLAVALLTNRVCPTRDNDKIGGVRKALHEMLAKQLEEVCV